MPKRSTKFDADWLIDSRFCSWIKQSTSSDSAYCSLCKNSFSVANGGEYQVLQHQRGQKHCSLQQSSKSQPKFEVSAAGTLQINSSDAKRTLSTEDQISSAEILLMLRSVKHNHSFRSSDDFIPVLRAAFNNPIVNGMMMSAAKVSYSITYGIAPYFHDQMVRDMSNTWYTLIVDETTTEQSVKQFDMHVRYWSPRQDKIVRCYFGSAFLSHACSNDLTSSVVQALSNDSLPITKLIHVGADGPNVNKAFKNQLNDSIVLLGGRKLIDIGSCNIHIVHNGFHAGIASVDQSWGVEDFLNDIFAFFRKYPSRPEDFAKVQAALNMEKKAFKRYVSNRWLSVAPVCCRIIESWSCLEHFFLKGEHSKAIKQSNMFTRICASLQLGNIMKARLHFLVSVAGIFEPFLLRFQSEATMVHLLIDELASVFRLLLQRFLKSDALTGKSDAQLLDISLDARSVEQCDFGSKTKELVRQLKKDNSSNVGLLQRDMLHFLKSCAKYLQERIPLKNTFLNNIRCLQSTMRSTPESNQMITALAKCLPHVSGGITFADCLSTEWLLYQADNDITPNWYEGDGENLMTVGQYWARVFKQRDVCGQPKYNNIMLVVKAALSVSHGQADVERGFSLNKHIITETRVSLKQKTIVALRTVQDVLSRHGDVEKVNVNQQLIRSYRAAHATYLADLETVQQKDKKATETEVKADDDAAKQTLKRKADIQSKQKDAEKLIAEANVRLTKAAESKDLCEMMAAQALLQSGHAKLTEARQEQTDMDNQSLKTAAKKVKLSA